MAKFLLALLGGIVLTWKHVFAVTLISNGTFTITPTATTQQPTATTCNVNCQFDIPTALSLNWMRFKPSATITAATIRIIINKENNTTRTSTILNELPEGVEPIPTNSDGTRTTQWMGYDMLTTTMAYPTISTSVDSTILEWGGVLSTKGVCTQTQGTVTIPPPHFPINTQTLDTADPKGYFYLPVWEVYFWRDVTLYMEKYLANEGFLQQCGFRFYSPLQAVQSVAFLTDTVIEFESGSPPKSTLAPTAHTTVQPSATRSPTAQSSSPQPPASRPPVPVPRPEASQPSAPQPAVPQPSAPRPPVPSQKAPSAPEEGNIPAIVSLIASLGAISRTFAAPPPTAQPAPPIPGPAAPLSAVTIPGPFSRTVPQQIPGSLPQPLQLVSITPEQSSALANNIPLPVITAGGNPLTLPGVSLIQTTILQVVSSTGADGVVVKSTATVRTSMAVGSAGVPVITVASAVEGMFPSLTAVTHTLGSTSYSVGWAFVAPSGRTDVHSPAASLASGTVAVTTEASSAMESLSDGLPLGSSTEMYPTGLSASAETSPTAFTTQGGRTSATSPTSPLFTNAAVKDLPSGSSAWWWSSAGLLLGVALGCNT